jgi:25S rRNA (uracil2843-N3)-methyltransferase
MAPPTSKAKSKTKQRSTQNRRQQNKESTAQHNSAPAIPLELQQLLLNIFKNSFSERLESDVHPLLQEIKGHLYNRDFLTAFGKEEYLEAYAARWSPSRALGYEHVFASLVEELQPFSGEQEAFGKPQWKVACLGGGAGAEIVALGGFLKRLENSAEEKLDRDISVAVIDIAAWENVLEKLRWHLVSKPPLSKYASTAAQAANTALLDPNWLNVSFHQIDVLNAPFPTMASLLQDVNLVTLMFTLNELYTTSLPLTQQFLRNLTSTLQPGSFLLVVDSPGSYSSVSLNGAEKKYPMQWLLDHTLLREERGVALPWEKVKEDESRWFRLDERLKFPIELEDMRFQLHLYRRLG